MSEKVNDELRARIEQLGTWYHKIDFGNGVTSDSKVNPQLIYSLINPFIKAGESLEGKSVLDLGCASGGLTLELAKRGAHVTALDVETSRIKQTKFVIQYFNLQKNVRIIQDSAYNAYKYGSFDIVIFCGLIYHLHHPLLMLDILSNLCKEQLFISSQIAKGDAWTLTNRRSYKRYNPKGPLLGFEPTKNFLEVMINKANFQNVKLISEAPHKGETPENVANNGVYFCADAPKTPKKLDVSLLEWPYDSTIDIGTY